MKKFKKVDYKGKWFTIQDKVFKPKEGDAESLAGLFDYVVGTITKKEALDPEFVKVHKEACRWYGIPRYIGDDKDLKKAYDRKK